MTNNAGNKNPQMLREIKLLLYKFETKKNGKDRNNNAKQNSKKNNFKRYKNYRYEKLAQTNKNITNVY